MAFKGRKSVSTLVRMALLGLQKEFTLALNEVEDEGYQKAKEEYEITFPCPICGLASPIPPNSECHNAVIQFLRERGWGHGNCVNKKK